MLGLMMGLGKRGGTSQEEVADFLSRLLLTNATPCKFVLSDFTVFQEGPNIVIIHTWQDMSNNLVLHFLYVFQIIV
jgi:hypothetical protein